MINLLPLFLFLLGYFFIILEQYRILQIQYYDNSRYLKVIIKQNYRVIPIIVAILSVILLFFFDYFFICFIIALIPYYHLRRKEKVVRLKYTKRIKRLLIGTIFILLIIIALGLLMNNLSLGIYLTSLYLLLPLVVISIKSMMHPIEAINKNHYLKLARNKLKRFPMLIIGISGSYGKTSTKNYLYNLLSLKYRVLKTPKSYNTLMGIVKTINEQYCDDYEIFIVEIGVDKKKGMNKILKLLDIDHSIITSIGPQHLATFHNIENIIEEKLKLAKASKGLIYLNNNNEYLRLVNQEFNGEVIRYSYQRDQVVKAYNLCYQDNFTIFEYEDNTYHLKLKTKVLGKHQLENLLPCIHLALHLGVAEDKIITQIRQLSNEEHRLFLSTHGHITLIDDAYNSNVTGFRAALEVLKERAGKRILVTPGLIELGALWFKVNEQLGEYAATCADEVILVGHNQTLPFKDGLVKGGFKLSNIIVVASFAQAKQRYLQEKELCVILIENDLPDIRIN